MTDQKAPSFPWYPGDWRRDTPLMTCSLEARGLWIELLNIMHDTEPRGHLAIRGRAIPEDRVASMVGATPTQYRRLLSELEDAGVPSRTEDGILFSRRMVRDTRLRALRAEAGSKGGTVSKGSSKRSSKTQASTAVDAQHGATSKPPSDSSGFAEGVAPIATATATAEAKAVAAAKGDVFARQLESVRSLIPEPDRAGFEYYLEQARFQPAFVGEILRLHAPIAGGDRFTGDIIGRALCMMLGNGEGFNVSRAAGYCRRIRDYVPRDVTSGSGDIWDDLEKKFAEEEASS